MRDNLDDSLKLMFGHEGGYSNVKTDAGGPTKYGITHRTLAAFLGVPSVTPSRVRDMTISEAETIYRRNYWPQAGGDLLPPGLDYAAFDFGVNSGPPRSVKTLQQVLGFKGKDVDGWIGAETMNRVANYPGGTQRLIRDYIEARMKFLRSLESTKTGFPVNGRGWTMRVLGVDPEGKMAKQPGVIGNALKMARGGDVAASVDTAPTPLPPSILTEAGAKAEPSEPNPWIKPEVLLPVVGGGGGTALLGFLQTDPIKAALSIGILAIIAVSTYLVFQRIRKSGQ